LGNPVAADLDLEEDARLDVALAPEAEQRVVRVRELAERDLERTLDERRAQVANAPLGLVGLDRHARALADRLRAALQRDGGCRLVPHPDGGASAPDDRNQQQDHQQDERGACGVGLAIFRGRHVAGDYRGASPGRRPARRQTGSVREKDRSTMRAWTLPRARRETAGGTRCATRVAASSRAAGPRGTSSSPP